MTVAGILQAAAASAPAPAVALSVFTVDGPVAEVCTGIADLGTARRAGSRSYWDLASLTKVLVTLPNVLDLAAAGAFTLDDPLAAVWPRAAAHGTGTIRQYLSYAAGLPPTAPLFRTHTGREAVLAAALAITPDRTAAAYSDLNYLLLGAMVEDLTGRPLHALSPFTFHPPAADSVATEQCPWRGRLIVGEVHDENASAMGGVAGHAGAFGTLAQVREAARIWLAGRYPDARTHWATSPEGDRYGLGWWLPPTRGIGGTRPGPGSFGISGFVGNRIWLEPAYGYGVVTLTNRIHPVRADRAPFNGWAAELLDTLADRLRDQAGRIRTASA